MGLGVLKVKPDSKYALDILSVCLSVSPDLLIWGGGGVVRAETLFGQLLSMQSIPGTDMNLTSVVLALNKLLHLTEYVIF